jgi:hypothetical protein
LLTCWLLLLEEYGITFDYLPGNNEKSIALVVDTSSCHEIDSLKIQGEEDVLTLLSGSEKNSITNINLTIPIHAALIFKEQEKNNQGIKRKELILTSLLNATY